MRKSLLHVTGSLPTTNIQFWCRWVRPKPIIWHLSFTYGEGGVTRHGRTLMKMTEASLSRLFGEFFALEVVSMSVTRDTRPGRSEDRWVKALVGKRLP
jgi:hypothetical protein